MVQKFNQFIQVLLVNFTAILFLLGVILIDYAIFNYIGEFQGFIAIGISLIFIAWLITIESDEGKR
ncbi:DUF1056 family protein [Macrococcoides goetzii]|nr:DUF1056 family protein [Macrococcus goetzii]TDM47755.1 DUF1056 family protein [Macrococcus goetzii]